MCLGADLSPHESSWHLWCRHPFWVLICLGCSTIFTDPCWCTWGSSGSWSKSMGLCYLCGSLEEAPGFVTAWISPSHCGHLGRTLADGNWFSVSLPLSLPLRFSETKRKKKKILERKEGRQGESKKENERISLVTWVASESCLAFLCECAVLASLPAFWGTTKGECNRTKQLQSSWTLSL